MTDHKYPRQNQSQDRARHVEQEKKHGQEHNQGHERKDQKHNQDQGQDKAKGHGAQDKKERR